MRRRVDVRENVSDRVDWEVLKWFVQEERMSGESLTRIVYDS